MGYPAPPEHVGKVIEARHPDGRVRRHVITGEIHFAQRGSKTKRIYLQRIRLDNGREELRLGYYIIGKTGSMKGRWVWGQYAAFLPCRDLKKVFQKAKKAGWL